MRNLKIDRNLFIQNRKKLSAQLKPNSLALVNANDYMPTNADGTMHFKQNTDLYWLTGVDQEETILVLFPDSPDPKLKEILFVKETSDLIAIWHGKKLSKAEATELTGIENIMWLSEFPAVFHALVTDCDNIYLQSNEHKRTEIIVQTRNARFIDWCQKEYPLHTYMRIAPIINRLRMIKSPVEIDLLQKACDLTEKGFRRVLKFTKPGVMEYEIEAEFTHEFISNGSGYADYYPIIASGPGACVLHYIKNDEECKDGDLVLIDTGAACGYYNADMTRTIPVNGKFTKRQKAVYNAVLRIMKSTIKLMVKGAIWKEIQLVTEQNTEKELVDLRILKMRDIKKQDPNKPLYKKYFMHNVSHYLGLDVHDVGYLHYPYKPGMVFTVEPGIYIPEEGIGIRLEDNILIKEKGNFDLMRNIPIEVDEIEELMSKK
ncbi:MAG TPA: aminopeptidase P N-terminal domain-containing protein [Ignavibacteria bacterium]